MPILATLLSGHWPIPSRTQPKQPIGAIRQTKTVSERAQTKFFSGSAELAPRGQRGGASILENLAAEEGTFLTEVVVNGAMQGGEFLQTSHQPEAQHRPLASSE